MAKERKQKPIPKTTKGKGANYRPTKKGAGMTKAGVKAHRRKNPGSKLKTAVTKKKNLTKSEKARRKSYCARSKGCLLYTSPSPRDRG